MSECAFYGHMLIPLPLVTALRLNNYNTHLCLIHFYKPHCQTLVHSILSPNCTLSRAINYHACYSNKLMWSENCSLRTTPTICKYEVLLQGLKVLWWYYKSTIEIIITTFCADGQETSNRHASLIETDSCQCPLFFSVGATHTSSKVQRFLVPSAYGIRSKI